MTKPVDDLEAVRLVIQALEPFDSKDRERIVRWAAEKLGMNAAHEAGPPSGMSAPTSTPGGPQQQPSTGPTASAAAKDIRSFVALKSPKSDNQMAAVVAYFHHFEAPQTERKDSIGKEELIDACRKSDRKRPARPEQVLVNTYHAGLFDKAGAAGQYRLNSVGENLVAMVLPEQNSPTSTSRRGLKAASRKRSAKKGSRRRSVTSESR